MLVSLSFAVVSDYGEITVLTWRKTKNCASGPFANMPNQMFSSLDGVFSLEEDSNFFIIIFN